MKNKYVFGLCLLLSIIIIALALVTPNNGPLHEVMADAPTVIIHTNDSHGRADDYLGFSGVAALKSKYEAEGCTVLVVDCGGTFHGLPFATLDRGEAIVEIMNLTGYAAMVPGNHDFNYGLERLRELDAQMNFPLLAANVWDIESQELYFKANLIIERNGVKYGLFGLVTPEAAHGVIGTCVFSDPVEAALKQVELLQAQGADYIIALTHLGEDSNSEFTPKLTAESVKGIDLILDGHGHRAYAEGYQVEDTLIASTGQYLENIGVVILNPDGSKTAMLYTSETWTEENQEIKAKIQELKASLEEKLDQEIAHTPIFLNGKTEEVQAKGTNLGDLTADAIRVASNAEISLISGGNIRASLEAGSVTMRDLLKVFPSSNYVIKKNVSGKEIIDALEVGLSLYPEKSPLFPQVSGLTFSVDMAKPAGSRIVDLRVDEALLEPQNTYSLATNNYLDLAEGYLNFPEYEITGIYGTLEMIVSMYLGSTSLTQYEEASRRITLIHE